MDRKQLTYKEQQFIGNHLAKVIEVGTKCEMAGFVYEAVNKYPYSDECDSPLYDLRVVNEDGIEQLRKQILLDKKACGKSMIYTEEELMQYRTIHQIEPQWFVSRDAKILCEELPDVAKEWLSECKTEKELEVMNDIIDSSFIIEEAEKELIDLD